MNTYEGMFIFPDRLDDDAVDAAVKEARLDIEKQGGGVLSGTRIGRRPFARPLKKTSHGHYAVIVFKIEPKRLPSLRNRYKLNERILRVQFIRVADEQPVKAAAGENSDG